MKDIEIEIHGKLEKSAPLLKLLKAKGKFISKQRQIDRYYNPPGQDFFAERPVRNWLRLRLQPDGKSSINYKLWHHQDDGTPTFCDEYESEVADIPSIQKIFAAIHFREAVVVDKIRETWIYKDATHNYEFAVDSVKNLGDFVEIEYKGREGKDNADKITAEMVNFLKKLGCGKVELDYDGYAYQLLFKNEAGRKKIF